MRVQVGARYTDGWLIGTGLLMAGLVAVTVIAFVGSRDSEPTLYAAGLTAAAGVLFAGQLWRVVRDRRWLAPTADGVLLTDRHGTHEAADSAVIDLATAVSTVYSNGVPSKQRRDGMLVVEGPDGERVVRVGYTFPLAGPDPLGAWLDRVFAGLLKRAEATLAAGGRLVGDDWALDAEWFDHKGAVFPLTELAAVAVADGHVCVWAVGATEATVRVPEGSPNALLLYAVLADRLDGRPEPTVPISGLGRLVFERDKSMARWKQVGGWLLVLLFALIVVGVSIGMANDKNGKDKTGGLVVLFIIGLVDVASAAHLWVNRVNHLKVFERGVSLRRRNRTYALRWADCGSYTHSATRRYVKGSYVGTDVRLKFDPAPGSGGDAVHYSAMVKNADDELDRLRGWVGAAVADRLAARLKAGEAVPWLPGLTFTSAGLEVRRGRLFGRQPPEVVPYSRVGTYTIKDGTFRLTLAGERKPAVRGSTAAANFFPGLELLHRLAVGS